MAQTKTRGRPPEPGAKRKAIQVRLDDAGEAMLLRVLEAESKGRPKFKAPELIRWLIERRAVELGVDKAPTGDAKSKRSAR